jgi:hypothetical protein
VLGRGKDAESTLQVLGVLPVSFRRPSSVLSESLWRESRPIEVSFEKVSHCFSEKGLLANIVSRRLARYIFTYEYGRDTIPDSNSD